MFELKCEATGGISGSFLIDSFDGHNLNIWIQRISSKDDPTLTDLILSDGD